MPMPGPPWSTITPLGTRSSSPRPPSVIRIVATLALICDGSKYQCGVGSVGVGPYFQYSAPPIGVGYEIDNVIVDPAMHPCVRKSKSPCGKVMLPGRVGGTGGAPGGGAMKRGSSSEHVGPPPL